MDQRQCRFDRLASQVIGGIEMGPLLVIMAVFLIALVVNNVLLMERCHQLEMRLRGDEYERWRNND